MRIFLLSALLFVLFSWLCGLAPNLETLIAFRVMQGLAAGPLIPLSQALLLSSYPREKAGMALAMWSMTTLIAPVAGPLLGGWITDNFSWPWIFYINVPVGLLAVYADMGIFHDRESPTQQAADRQGRPRAAGALDRRRADHARQGQGARLVREPRDRGARDRRGRRFVFFLIWELTEQHPIVDLPSSPAATSRWAR